MAVCQSNHRSESGSGFWQLQLDRDLVDTISAIYPDWFQSSMAESGTGASTPRESPPKAVVDTSPLHIDQNKESLKVKLMLRRPFDQLVAQGIMPPHKTPAAFHGQRRQLERAKTGDMLKAKIQQRPPRQELERRHILESDPAHVDPSLAERQRMLKKARLADQLNDQLSHRPGPLELIQKNILHTEEPIEQAVKTGRIPYKATSEGQLNRPQHPLSYINQEDDSQSSEGDLVSPGPSDVLETAAKSAGIVVGLIPADSVLVKDSDLVFADLCRSVVIPQVPVSSPVSSLSPLSSVASPTPPPLPPTPVVLTRPLPKSDAPGKDKNRKKSKNKSTPKARTIKFHEYKGPPSAQKTTNSQNPGESSYDLLLQQQTLLLQFQLQLQHKYPQIILPASQKLDSANNNNNNNNINNNTQIPSPAPSSSSETSVTPARLPVRLEDMKVSDLKAELKRRNLPVSGSKPQLIERLKPFSEVPDSTSNGDLEQSPSPESLKDDMEVEPLSPESNEKTKEEIVREQQRRIEELQRELTLSKLRLQEATRAEPKAQLLALQKHLQARQQQQQQMQLQQLRVLQEEQQRLQQQQHVAFQNQKNNLNGLVLNSADATLVFNLMAKAKTSNGHHRPLPIVTKSELIEDVIKPPPPQYEEATKQKKSSVKSQIVDDVLEILIKNGELPPSAANDPTTPSSAGAKPAEAPVFPSSGEVESALELDPSEILDGLDNLDNMDFSQFVMELGEGQQMASQEAVPMDTDEWLESLCAENGAPLATQESSDLVGYDPLMGLSQDPFDPFNLEEFQSPGDLTASLSWDKVDYAA